MIKFGKQLAASYAWLCKPPYYGVPWIVWLYAVLACAFTTQGGVFTGQLFGYDDHVRMVQVLEWINGHGWYDRTITRVNEPQGFTTIWSRIVDIPIALVILAAQQFVTQKTAALIAAVIVPFAELAVLFAVARYYARPLVGKKDARLVILFLMFTSVMNFHSFSVAGFHTGEASHHSWYVILDLLLFGAAGRVAIGVMGRSPILMMAAAVAGLMAVGIEGFPMIAGAIAIIAATAWYGNRPVIAQRAMQSLLFAALFGLLLLPIHQPLTRIFDISFVEPSLLGPILMTFAAVFMAIEAFILARCGERKILGICFIFASGLVASAILILIFPQILNGPAAGLTPSERVLVFTEHAESTPLYKVSINQLHFLALAMPCIIALTAGIIAAGNAKTIRRRTLYMAYFGFSAITGGAAEFISRFYHHALTAACPWLLWVWQRIRNFFAPATKKPRFSPKRKAILLTAFFVIGPLWMLVIPTWEEGGPFWQQLPLYPAKQQMFQDPCNIVGFSHFLNTHYSKDTKLMVPGMDSSRILYHTDMRIDFLNNYPSQDKFIDNQVFFGTQDKKIAKEIARRHGFDLVAICPYLMNFAPLAPGEAPMLMESLVAGPPPPWLRVVRTNVPGGYMLYKVDKTELMK